MGIVPKNRTWDLFCRVIDNHGDIGVCWRLATDLAARGERVRLWVDEPSALGWMAPGGADGVTVHAFGGAGEVDEAPGDVVIEAFGCDLPQAFVHRMATARSAPLWINLEYLSAEAYVERSHRLPSPQLNGPGPGS
ncbi:MAG TPA: elongation factor P maturation arginine rhamnosyltransferase EarP, partial [Burkholderiaceae bacterium]|nr:elongation factor P maturation arginine rhamnosyltransferase EarP [Burkholderiaceae bacterium]